VSLKKPIGSKYFLTQAKGSIFGIELNGSLFPEGSYGPKIRLYPSSRIGTSTSSGRRIRLTRAENEPTKIEN
jgi:hypothetical protein